MLTPVYKSVHVLIKLSYHGQIFILIYKMRNGTIFTSFNIPAGTCSSIKGSLIARRKAVGTDL